MSLSSHFMGSLRDYIDNSYQFFDQTFEGECGKETEVVHLIPSDDSETGISR